MTSDFQTPVVIILFNRPDRVRDLIGVLRHVRPRRILAIADGPRPDCPSDMAQCRAARDELARIDWPCAQERTYAEVNLGCDRRILTGLDWVFSRVSQAIILEDDVLPHPGFLPWAEAMLERCRNDPDVLKVSGHNPLGRWPLAGNRQQPQNYIRARRGSMWGWATTASDWRALQATDINGPPDQATNDLVEYGLDLLLAAYYTPALAAWRRGLQTAWDMILGIKIAARRGVAAVSSVNLVRNTGIGAGATRTTFAGDFSGLVPVASAPADLSRVLVPDIDPEFDRAAMLVQLLSRCVNPRMACRLARSVARGSFSALDSRLRLHLVPFTVPAESLRLLEHLNSLGVASPAFDELLATFRAATCGEHM